MKTSYTTVFFLSIPFIVLLYPFEFPYPKSLVTYIVGEEKTTTTTEEPATETTDTTIITTPAVVLLNIDDRKPSYKLAVQSGNTPFSSINQKRTKILDNIRVYETCQKDRSNVVIDVGAHLGDFGLYAAACACTVYIFEVQPKLVALIQSSITANAFSSPPVNLIQKAVSDLPSKSTMKFPPIGSEAADAKEPFEVSTVRLDDMTWPSSIFILKIDFDGFNLNVLHSADNLFREKRIRHLIFKYTIGSKDRATQQELLVYVTRVLRPRQIYVHHPTKKILYGPLYVKHLTELKERNSEQPIQIDFYALFDRKIATTSIKVERFDSTRFFS